MSRRLMRLGIALGSNVGNRLEWLRFAAGKLKLALHEAGFPFLTSAVYETAPMGCPEGSPVFLNAAVELEFAGELQEALRFALGLEREAGRERPAVRNAPRTLDVDLLYCGDVTMNTPDLVLPHPRIGERLFVVAPLSEIAPDKVLPGCPQGVLARRRELEAEQSVRRLAESLLP